MTVAPPRNEYLRSPHDGSVLRGRCRRRGRTSALPAPLVWTFDGPFERCLADLEDTLRRAIVMVGGVSRVALLIDLSLPALQRRVAAGDALQPGLGPLPGTPGAATACRRRRGCATCARAGPLATLVIAYRN